MGAISPVAAPSMDGPIGTAAKKFADAAFPVVQSIDWANTGPLDKYVANTPANKEALKAVLDAGLAMDPKAIQAAAQAHLDALNAADGKLVTDLPNMEKVTVALAKLIASAPAGDALKSYQAFLETAAAVKR